MRFGLAKLGVVLALIASVLALSPLAPQAQAQGAICTPSSESGLRSCILDANGRAFDTRIVIGQDIQLSELLPSVTNNNGGTIHFDGLGHSIDATFAGSAFVVSAGTVFFTNLELFGGATSGIFATNAAVIVHDVTIHSGAGDGILAMGTADITGTNLTLQNLGDDGIEIRDSARATLQHATIADNGFGLYDNSSGSLTMNNSILVRNGRSCAGASPGGTSLTNLIDDASLASVCAATTSSNLSATMPGPLVESSECPVTDCVPTLELLPGSQAIDIAACPSTIFSDARGVPRLGLCDAGAYEAFSCEATTTAGDAKTLSYVIGCFNNADLVVLNSVTLTSDLTLSEPLLPVNRLGSGVLRVRGDGHTIDGGDGTWPGFFLEDGILDVQRVEISNAQDGIVSIGGRFVLDQVLLQDNSRFGAFIAGAGEAAMQNTTIFDNVEGIRVANNAVLDTWGVTIANHNFGIVTEEDATVILRGTLIARNGTACFNDGFTLQSGNVINDSTCGGPSNPGVGLDLAADVARNGAPTTFPDTLALLPGSAAIDAGNCAELPVDARGVVRPGGATNPCDAGAYELGDLDVDDDAYEGPLGDNTDCDDDNPAINPGATDIPNDGIDQDCIDGDNIVVAVDLDVDDDGYEGPLGDNTDCDDDNPAINPGATDIPNDGIDQDCIDGDNIVLCDGIAVTIDMNTGAGGQGTNGRDIILGTPGDDIIDAGGGNDVICAGGGDDTVVGGDGDDKILGEAGRDILRGGPGVDIVDGGDGNDRLLGGIGNDTMYGRDGNDYLGGFGGADRIFGGNGNERIFGGFGADKIDGGAGNDVISGLIGDDTIVGGPGNDTLNGDRGNDTISGDDGDDTINGGNADDILNGGSGDDEINGGRADDDLIGDDGFDVCVGNRENSRGDTADASCEQIFGVP